MPSFASEGQQEETRATVSLLTSKTTPKDEMILTTAQCNVNYT